MEEVAAGVAEFARAMLCFVGGPVKAAGADRLAVTSTEAVRNAEAIRIKIKLMTDDSNEPPGANICGGAFFGMSTRVDHTTPIRPLTVMKRMLAGEPFGLGDSNAILPHRFGGLHVAD